MLSTLKIDTINPINNPFKIDAHAKLSLPIPLMPIIIKSSPTWPINKNIKEFNIKNKIKKSLFEISISFVKNFEPNKILRLNRDNISSKSSSVRSILFELFTKTHLFMTEISFYLSIMK